MSNTSDRSAKPEVIMHKYVSKSYAVYQHRSNFVLKLSYSKGSATIAAASISIVTNNYSLSSHSIFRKARLRLALSMTVALVLSDQYRDGSMRERH